jgi:signal transduction histidine kinase
MKLIEKTTFYYLVFTLFIFALGTGLFYFLIRTVLIDGIDEALHQEKIQITENLAYENDFKYLKPTENVTISLSDINHTIRDKYTTVSFFDSLQNDKVRFRELKSVYFHRNKYYEITIRQPLDEAEALIEAILPVEIVLFLVLLAGILIINRSISNKIWKDFYKLLGRLQNYNLAKNRIISYQKSDIDEFDNLSEIVAQMTEKIYNDYISQKEFNENSSHELQTPLAIIRNKLELLIQSKNLKQEDMEIIEVVFDAIKRLTQLNKGLILLSEIDNQQYDRSEKVNMNLLLKKILSNFEDKIDSRKILLKLISTEECELKINGVLAEVLLTNLISNAIKHNISGGILNIELTENYLKIANTGTALPEPASNMFERFKKKSDSEFSVGLGLSIVKKICDLFRYNIEYVNTKSIHSITITF